MTVGPSPKGGGAEPARPPLNPPLVTETIQSCIKALVIIHHHYHHHHHYFFQSKKVNKTHKQDSSKRQHGTVEWTRCHNSCPKLSSCRYGKCLPVEEVEAPRHSTHDDILTHSTVFCQRIEHLPLLLGGRPASRFPKAFLYRPDHVSPLRHNQQPSVHGGLVLCLHQSKVSELFVVNILYIHPYSS